MTIYEFINNKVNDDKLINLIKEIKYEDLKENLPNHIVGRNVEIIHYILQNNLNNNTLKYQNESSIFKDSLMLFDNDGDIHFGLNYIGFGENIENIFLDNIEVMNIKYLNELKNQCKCIIHKGKKIQEAIANLLILLDDHTIIKETLICIIKRMINIFKNDIYIAWSECIMLLIRIELAHKTLKKEHIDCQHIEYILGEWICNKIDLCIYRQQRFNLIRNNLGTFPYLIISILAMNNQMSMCSNKPCICASKNFGDQLQLEVKKLLKQDLSNIWSTYGQSEGAISYTWGQKLIINEEQKMAHYASIGVQIGNNMKGRKKDIFGELKPSCVVSEKYKDNLCKVWLDIKQSNFNKDLCRKEYEGTVVILEKWLLNEGSRLLPSLINIAIGATDWAIRGWVAQEMTSAKVIVLVCGNIMINGYEYILQIYPTISELIGRMTHRRFDAPICKARCVLSRIWRQKLDVYNTADWWMKTGYKNLEWFNKLDLPLLCLWASVGMYNNSSNLDNIGWCWYNPKVDSIGNNYIKSKFGNENATVDQNGILEISVYENINQKILNKSKNENITINYLIFSNIQKRSENYVLKIKAIQIIQEILHIISIERDDVSINDIYTKSTKRVKYG